MSEKAKLIDEMKKRMDGALNSLNHDTNGLRTGRASPNLLDNIRVEAYGDFMPIGQLATVSVPEARMIVVQVWDKEMAKAVEKSIVNSNLGLNPVAEGQMIRISIPPLSEERRKELVKVAHEYAEKAKIAIRNVRRDGMDNVKKMQKDGVFSEDEQHIVSDEIQKITDQYIKNIDNIVAIKEKEILTV
jgi:ribosome recycling factor